MSKPTKILLVDDDPSLRAMTSEMLASANYEVMTASTGLEGLALVRQRHPDVVLQDVELPDVNGIEICRRIKSDPEIASTLVVIMSGKWTSADHQNAGLRARADGYITRPFQMDDFLSRIETFARIAHDEKLLRESEQQAQAQTAKLSVDIAQLREQIAKRRQADEALRKSILVTQTTLDSLAVQIAVMDAQGVIIATNQAWEQFVRDNPGSRFDVCRRGASYTEACARTARAGDPLAQQALAGIKAVQSGARASFELEYPCDLPSEKRWFAMRVTPLGDASGATVVTHENITERKQAEELYRAYLQRLTLAAEAAVMGVWEWDVRTHAATWDNRMFEMYGLSKPEPMTYRRWTELVHPEDMAKAERHLHRVAAGNEQAYFGFRIIRPSDGETRQIRAAASAVLDGQGQVVKVVGVNFDITKHKQAEEAARENEAILRTFFDSPGMMRGIVELVDGDILHVADNAAAAAFFGRTPETMRHQLASQLGMPAAMIQSWTRHYQESKQQGAPVSFEYSHAADSEIRWWLATVSYLAAGPSGRERYGYMVLDITAAKRAEEMLQRLNVELEQRVKERTLQFETVNKELEAFTYSVSHDLRAPLRHIQGYTEMLAKETQDRLSAKAQRHLQVIADASEKMSQLVDDLLSFSRMGRTEMHETKVALERLVQETIQDLEMATRGRAITWNIAPLPAVIGDRSMLKQVFANLLDNAVKYSRPRNPAEIEIGCSDRQDGWGTFFVRDNGVGFDMKYAHRLFGVFQRLHRADEFEGTGIGLANVRRIVARHGGRVWIEAAVNKGTAVFVTLKLSPSK